MSGTAAALAASTLAAQLVVHGCQLLHRGKVRDTYTLPGQPGVLLVVTSDRLSIFDFVLPTEVPKKGEVLVALSDHWFRRLSRFGIRHHLQASGAAIDAYLPQPLRGNAELQRRAVVVQQLQMLPIECIVRGYLTGSGWKAYQGTGEVCGFKLPEGLHDGSQLPAALFTPTTKAEAGHDEHLGHGEVVAQYGTEVESLSLRVYLMLQTDAQQAGIIVADTKFEFGCDDGGLLVIGDEVGTPDSSRFWDDDQWRQAAAERRAPSGFDKEPVRQWGSKVATPRGVGLSSLSPAEQYHVEWVRDELVVPPQVVADTTERYLGIFRRLTGYSLLDYQRSIMGIY